MLALCMCALGWSQTPPLVRKIVIQGNQQVSREAILAAMQVEEGQPFTEAQLTADKRALEELGFFKAVDVRAATVEGENAADVYVDLVEWPVIKEIRVVGNKALSTEEILSVISIEVGQVFNLRNVRVSVAAIQELYTKKNYFARVGTFEPMEDSPGTLNIEILETMVSEVNIKGNTKTKASVIDKIIRTRPGDPFNLEKWREDLSRLFGTGWFEDVRSEQQHGQEINDIELTAVMEETRTGTFGLGLQVDPRSSFAGFIRLADTNFRGTGQSLSVNYLQSTSGGGPSVDLSYANPFWDDRGTAFRASVYSRLIYRFAGTLFGGNEEPDERTRYRERRTGLSLGFSRPIREKTTGFINARVENIKTDLRIDDDNDPNTPPVPVPDGFIQQDGDVFVLTFGGILNRRDVDREPAAGDWFRLDIEPGFSRITEVGGLTSNNSILGDNFFVRTTAEYRRYWSPQPPRGLNLSEPRRVFAFRLKAGTIQGEVPFFEQFFAGGSETVRGYQEDRFWGKHSVLATLEYRHPIQRSFNAVLFADYGGAWGGYGTVNEFSQSDKWNMHFGYGIGFSFTTPLGPIRLDFGVNENGSTRTHFKIGTSF